MNHIAYRHVSMPCPVMRGSLWLMREGSGEFEVVGRAGDGAKAVAVWAVRNGLLRRLAAGAHCGEAAPQQGTNPTYIFTEPRVGYRIPKGGTAETRGCVTGIPCVTTSLMPVSDHPKHRTGGR